MDNAQSSIRTNEDGSLAAYKFRAPFNAPVCNDEHPLTDIVFIQDWDENEDAPEFGDIQAMAEYLSQWDYGDETDFAHPVTSWGAGTDDEIWTVNTGGLVYLLTLNYHLRYAGLYRRPL